MAGQTLAKIAPRLGMTLPGIRTVLARAGLLDVVDNRPTQAGHVLAKAHFFERTAQDREMRFPVWDEDQLIRLIPSLDPGDASQSMFKSRYGAAHALQKAAMTLRDRLPANLSNEISPLAGDDVRERIVSFATPRERADWVFRNVVPVIGVLEERLRQATSHTGRIREIEDMKGAACWLSGRSTPRDPDVDKLPFRLEAPQARDMRPYPESYSIVLSEGELSLLEAGYELNHRKPRSEDAELSWALLGQMSERLLPDAPSGVHRHAAGMPARATRHARDTFLLTMRGTGEPGRTMVSAHRVVRNDNRINVRTHPTAFLLLAKDAAQPVAQHGPQALVERLRQIATSQTHEDGEA